MHFLNENKIDPIIVHLNCGNIWKENFYLLGSIPKLHIHCQVPWKKARLYMWSNLVPAELVPRLSHCFAKNM